MEMSLLVDWKRFGGISHYITFSPKDPLQWMGAVRMNYRKSYYGLVFYSEATSWWICFLQTHSCSLLQMLTDGLEWCGLLVDYCDVFISCLEDPLVRKWSDEIWWRNKLIYILDGLRVSTFSTDDNILFTMSALQFCCLWLLIKAGWILIGCPCFYCSSARKKTELNQIEKKKKFILNVIPTIVVVWTILIEL